MRGRFFGILDDMTLTSALNWIVGILTAVFFLVLFILILSGRRIPVTRIRLAIGTYIVLVVMQIVFSILLVYYAWKGSNSAEVYFTFPYSNKIYSVLSEALAYFGVSVAVGIVVIALLSVVRKKRSDLLESQDVWLLGFGGMIAGWPQVLIFLVLVFLCTVIFKILRVALKKEQMSDRILITPAIPPAVIIIIFFGDLLARWTGLWVLR